MAVLVLKSIYHVLIDLNYLLITDLSNDVICNIVSYAGNTAIYYLSDFAINESWFLDLKHASI